MSTEQCTSNCPLNEQSTQTSTSPHLRCVHPAQLPLPGPQPETPIRILVHSFSCCSQFNDNNQNIKTCMWQLLCILPFFSIITMTQKYRKGWHINKRIKTSLDSLHSFHRRRHTHYQPHQHSTESVAVHYNTLHCDTLKFITIHRITLWYTTIHYNTSHYIVIHWNSLQYITFPNVKSHYIKFTYITHQRRNPINIPLSPLLFYLISRGDLKYALQNTNSHQTMTIVLNDFNVDCCHSKH